MGEFRNCLIVSLTQRRKNWKKIHLTAILYTVLFLLAGLLITVTSQNSSQAAMSIPMPLQFEGEYSAGGGEWKPLDENADLSVYQGDITLRGSFGEELPEGIGIHFYLNHIGMDICRDGELLYESSLEQYPGMCGSTWLSCELPAVAEDDELEIHLTSQHRFGNRNAYSQFLDSICTGSEIAVENILKQQSAPYRAAGIFIAVVSVALIGTAAGYRLIALPDSSFLLKAGLMSLMMGGYMYLDAESSSLWSTQLASVTCARRLCMMLAALFLVSCVTELLHGKRKKLAQIAAAVLMVTDIILIAVSFAGVVELYDTGICWAAVQGIISLLLMIASVMEIRDCTKKSMLLSAAALLAVLLLELLNAWMDFWKSGFFIKIVFTVLFVFQLVRGAWQTAQNHRESIRAEELRIELRNSRIVLSSSQIRTHFVFNVLNAVSGMCGYDPEKADETLVTFSRYLRSNINIMEDDEPEAFQKALEYLEQYISLEQVRFGEKIRFVKDIGTDSFKIPPLVLQPIVENAIKHGLLPKKEGGTVTLRTWKEQGDNRIEITDDGVGFDTEEAPRGQSVGMRNVRFRLKYMVGGTMDVTSTPGHGTTVTIRIPEHNNN